MRTSRLLSLCVVLTGIVLGICCLWVRRARADSHVAFRATQVYTFFLGPNQPKSQMEETYALRSDGSSVKQRIRYRPDRTTYEIRSVTDVPQGRRAVFDQLTQSITTTVIQDEELRRLSSKPGSCASDQPSVGSTLLGFDVFRLTQKLPAPPGLEYTAEIWIAPALGCFPLKTSDYRSEAGGGGRWATMTLEVKEVVLGEPPPELFSVPTVGLTERKPTDVLKERERILVGQPVTSCPTQQNCSTSVLDDAYQSRQK